MESIATLWAMLVIWALGSGLSRHGGLTGPAWARTRIGRPAWAWGLGTAAAGVVLAWATWLTGWFGVWPVYVAAVLAWLIRPGERGPAAPDPPLNLSWTGRIAAWGLVILLSLVTLDRCGGDLGWDGWAVWGIKARAIHGERRLETGVVGDMGRYGFSHPEYPPLMPLLEAFVYRHVGAVDERHVGLLHAAWCWCAAILLLGLLRQRLPDRWAVVVTLLVVAQRPFWQSVVTGQADVPLAAANLMVLSLLGESGASAGIGLALAGALLLKNEGMVTWGATAAALLVAGPDRPDGRIDSPWTVRVRALTPVLVAAASFVPWFVICRRHGLAVDLFVHGTAPVARWAHRAGSLAAAVAVRAAAIPGPAVLLWLAVSRLAFEPRPGRRASVFAGALAAGLLLPYVVTWKDQAWLFQTSLDRILCQLLPVMIALPARAAQDPAPR
ncbi:MAG: hypothetical protein HY815_22145, partial [Candidatus Riflebacteria bacterium]|nr:hypothetical protein [Candidatus Riflebacteria bacterium]